MVLVVARPQCVVASAGVGIVVGCARDRTSKEMVFPDRSEESDLVANATTVSAASTYSVLDVVVAAAFAAAATRVVVTATAAVTIAAVTTATATANAAVTATTSPATANTAVFNAMSMIALAANQASSAIRQMV